MDRDLKTKVDDVEMKDVVPSPSLEPKSIAGHEIKSLNSLLADHYSLLNNSQSAVSEEQPTKSAVRGTKKAVRRLYAPSTANSNSSGGGNSTSRSSPTDANNTNSNWVSVEYPVQRYRDFGGIDAVIDEIRELVERPIRYPEVYRHLGVLPSCGILLYGPPGCGKTALALSMAGELGLALLRIAAPEIVSGMSGESESKIRDLFAQARRLAPCLVLIDEIDAITPKRETAQREMERRIVAQLLASMDDLGRNVRNKGDDKSRHSPSHDGSEVTTMFEPPVIVIGTTNRPDALDPALRRAGRFDREIKLGVPDEAARRKMLPVVCRTLRLGPTVDFVAIARRTPGYVGADLVSLAKEAAAAAIRRIFGALEATNGEDGGGDATTDQTLSSSPSTLVATGRFGADQLTMLAVEMVDFETALSKVQPSAKREGFAVVPDVSWDDIGALQTVREELRLAVVEPIRSPELFASVGLELPTGVLLCGPPGCGKTLLAKAVAHESHSNFISVKGPELLNKYVGESERAVRQVFERARNSAPCIIFFDELDALCPRRRDGDGGDAAASRVVNQLLTEMDGLEGRRGVYVMAATNRPDMIDPAMTRPGRLEKMLYVGLPSAEDRYEILQAIGRKTPWSPTIDLRAVASDARGERFSGADLAALVREASLQAIKLSLLNQDPTDTGPTRRIVVEPRHVDAAFEKVRPSVVSEPALDRWLSMRKKQS